jgi:hypothetical protein
MAEMPDESPRRIFKLEEAQKLLPTVRARTLKALEEMTTLDVPFSDDDEEETRREKLDQAASVVFEEWAQDLHRMGIEVKGPWLVDFDSGAGYYCWKWPEESLEFFHGYDEGFAGRVRLQ